MQSGCFSYSIASCAVNSPTEDAYCVLMSENVSLFAVFDGHGKTYRFEMIFTLEHINVLFQVEVLLPSTRPYTSLASLCRS